MGVLLRDVWNFQQERLSPMWTLTKGQKTAECVVWSHHFGWELRLSVGADLIQSQVVRSAEELVELQERWRAAMSEKGWR